MRVETKRLGGVRINMISEHEKRIKKHYNSLYPGETEAYEGLIKLLNKYKKNRSKTLQKLDDEGTAWLTSGNTVGMMLYVDLFSETLEKLIGKVNYFEKLGITLIHLMPVLEARVGENDGGYAVKNYREIDPKLGDMAIFEKLVKAYHKKGIRVCIDYVLNHTADDHEWAIKAKQGNPTYQSYYWMFDDRRIPDQFENTLNQVFPNVAPGNFTFLPELDKWVMTTFYPFQWDLNYGNPWVLNEMIENLLFLANKGVDMIRLDAIPYIWKQLGTSSRNLPQVHEVMAIFREVVAYCSPSTALLGEAIVQPEIIVKYFGTEQMKECHTLYNASFMVEIWNALATRDARHINHMPYYPIPSESTWINYARCHDDIGWGLDEGRIRELGFDPHAHKMFLIDFYHGILKDSFALGELYEFNPETLDARNSGTLASLAGLEKAILKSDRYQRELAIKRIQLIHAMFMFKRGVPMLYSGDEIAALNDHNYKRFEHKKHDSRWLHRSPFKWEDAEQLGDHDDPKAIVNSDITKLIEARKAVYGDVIVTDEHAIVFSNHHVLGFKQTVSGSDDDIVLLFNLSEDRQWIYSAELKRYVSSGIWKEQLTGKGVDFDEEKLLLGPYEIFLLQK